MKRRTFSRINVTITDFNSPKDHGATGDGTTDDTTAFQSAIDALPADGGVIVLEQGDYNVPSPGGLTTGGRSLFWLLGGTVGGSFAPALPGTILNNTSNVTDFTDLGDVPSYSGNGLLFLRLNAGETALEFASGGSGLADIVDDTTPQLGGQLDVNGNAIGDGTRELVTFTEDASAVNHINVENEATGSGPIIRAAGDDAAIDINIEPKSTGLINLNGTVTITDDIQHAGDTNNKIALTTDAQSFETGGSSRLDINDSGVRLGGSGARVTTVLDEDNMASDSATAIPTQQSVKAYVDSNAGGDWAFLGTQDFSNDASADFTGFNASLYDSYKVELYNVVPSSNGESLLIRTSTDGGSTFDTSGYAWAIMRVEMASASPSTGDPSTDNEDSGIRIAHAVGSGSGEDGASCEFTILGPHLAKKTAIVGNGAVNGVSGAYELQTFAGYRKSSADVDAIRLIPTSGALLETGTWSIWGRKNS